MLRAFVAIELDATLCTALAKAQEPLRNSRSAKLVRWVRPDAVHLTLKFLGNVPASQVSNIGHALQLACASFAPFAISLTDLGVFPHARRPRVIWVGVGGDLAVLKNLHQALDRELGRLGFGAEKRGFAPHLTLGRFKDRALPHQRQETVELMRSVSVLASATMTVREVSLIRSDLRPTGAVYSRLSSAMLTAAQTNGSIK